MEIKEIKSQEVFDTVVNKYHELTFTRRKLTKEEESLRDQLENVIMAYEGKLEKLGLPLGEGYIEI